MWESIVNILSQITLKDTVIFISSVAAIVISEKMGVNFSGIYRFADIKADDPMKAIEKIKNLTFPSMKVSSIWYLHKEQKRFEIKKELTNEIWLIPEISIIWDKPENIEYVELKKERHDLEDELEKCTDYKKIYALLKESNKLGA